MKNITPLLDKIYQPYKALLFYSSEAESGHYVESYDMDNLGRPINAHPLSVKESEQLALGLKNTVEKSHSFLQPEGLIPENVLHYDSTGEYCALWFTRERKQHLLFRKDLGIDDGEAYLPPLLWRATRSQVWLWALDSGERPNLSTPLHFAPFFNCYPDGRVCMGNVDVEFSDGCSLEKFISEWERFYFGSAFSHLLGGVSPVKGNIVQLWKKQTEKGKAFPKSILKKTGRKLKEVIR